MARVSGKGLRLRVAAGLCFALVGALGATVSSGAAAERAATDPPEARQWFDGTDPQQLRSPEQRR
jgi:hypothetical protein